MRFSPVAHNRCFRYNRTVDNNNAGNTDSLSVECFSFYHNNCISHESYNALLKQTDQVKQDVLKKLNSRCSKTITIILACLIAVCSAFAVIGLVIPMNSTTPISPILHISLLTLDIMIIIGLITAFIYSILQCVVNNFEIANMIEEANKANKANLVEST